MSVMPGTIGGGDADGAKYEWYNVDQVFDYLMQLGIRPVVELSFMPKALVTCGGDGEPSCAYVHGNNGGYKGLQMVPDNYEDWYKLVRALAEHLVGRYGLSEIKAWHFEVWNEMQGLSPNKGLPRSYMQLFNASARALKDVSPMLRVGGPATMQLLEVENFTRNCSAWSPPIPIDFITTHLCKYNS